MAIERVVCPCCNSEVRVNVPNGREIVDVFVPATILTSLMRRHDRRMLCPKCTIEVFVRFAIPVKR
jgi:hypothetical protein